MHPYVMQAFADELSNIMKHAAMIRGIHGVMPLFGEAVKDVHGGISGIGKVLDPGVAAKAIMSGKASAEAAQAARAVAGHAAPAAPVAAVAKALPRRPPPLPSHAPGGLFHVPAGPSPYAP